jgi:hypothetical protein
MVYVLVIMAAEEVGMRFFDTGTLFPGHLLKMEMSNAWNGE